MLSELLSKLMQKKTMEILLFLLCCLFIISSSVNHVNVSRQSLLLIIIFLSLYFMLRFACVEQGNLLFYIIYIIIVIWGIEEAICGILQVYKILPSNHSLFATTGHFKNPGPYAGFLSFTSSVEFAYLMSKSSIPLNGGFIAKEVKVIKIVTSVGLFLAMIIMPATMSRSAWISFGLSCMAFLFCFNAYIRSFVLRNMHYLGLSLIAICFLLALFKTESFIGRFHIWNMDIRAMLDNPCLGVGYGASMGAYASAQEFFFKSKERPLSVIELAGCPEYPFNEYLGIGMQTGIIGFSLSLIIVMLICFKLYRCCRPFFCGAVSLAIFSLSSYTLCVWQLVVCIIFCMVLSDLDVEDNTANKGKMSHLLCETLIITFLSIICVSSLVYSKTQHYVDDMLMMADYNIACKNNDDAIDQYSKIQDLVANTDYLFNYGKALYKSGRYYESILILSSGFRISCDPMFPIMIGKCFEELGDYAGAEEYYFQSHFMAPSRLYPYLLIVHLYERLGRNKDALNVCQEALQLPVNTNVTAMVETHRMIENEYRSLCQDEK